MMSYLLGHGLSKWAPMEATKQYPQWCDAIDDKQSVTLNSLLFFVVECYPFASVVAAVRGCFL